MSDQLEQAATGDVAPVVYDVVRLPNPALGADPIFTVPGNQVWQVLALTGVLVTSAVVANRRPSVIVDDQTTTLTQVASGIVTAASLTTRYSFTGGYDLETGAAGAAVSDPFLADVAIPAGYRLRFSTFALDVNDQWSAVTAWIRRISTGITPLAVAREAVQSAYDDPVPFLT